MTKDEVDELYYRVCRERGYVGAAQLPRHVLRNWITRESGYRYNVVSSIGERGYMQVGKAWAADRNIVGAEFVAVSSIPVRSMEVSARMVEETCNLVRKRLHDAGVYLSGDDFWWAVKLYHALPNLFNGMLRASLYTGAPPELQPRPRSVADLRARASYLGRLGPGSWMDRRKRGGLDHRGAVERVLKNADATAYGGARNTGQGDSALADLLRVEDAEANSADAALTALLEVK